MYKNCTKCLIDKPATTEYFHNEKNGKYGLRSVCKLCIKTNYQNNKKQLKEYSVEHYKRNKQKRKEQIRQWRENNKDKIREYRSQWEKRQGAHFRILKNLRKRIGEVVKGHKSDTTLKLLGCDMERFRTHLESQFTEGMTWDNYGVHGWHVDHIRPCCSFDLTDPEQQKICFNYKNLQPLWAKDNMSKGGRYNGSTYQ